MEKNKENVSNIEVKVKVNEVFSVTEVVQWFKNDSEESKETKIFLPKINQLQFSRLKAKIGEREVVSKVYSKEKAEEKYSDSVASGNTGFLGVQKNSLEIFIGNVEPKEIVELSVEYLQSNNSDKGEFSFYFLQNFPVCSFSNSEEKQNRTLKTTINLSAKSPITDFEFKDKDSEKKYTVTKSISEDGLTGEMSFIKTDFIKGDIYTPVLPIVFKTKESSTVKMISQFDEEKNETSYSLYWLFKNSSLTEEKDDNFTPGLFIFLIDQSGSMRGNPINLVKEALIVFMKSLPPESYFQIIGFGSDFKKYQDEPLKYDNENVQKALSIIKGITANMGGTEISLPLKEILQERSNIYNKIDLPRHIMLLTDGEDFNKEESLKIITSLSDSFRVHSFGLGSDFDKDLIERSAFYGKGVSSFVNDVTQIEKEIIKTLGKCLKPCVVGFSVKNSDVKEIYFPQKSQVVYSDSMVYFSFILPGKNALSNKDFEITGKIIDNDTKKDLNEIVSVKEADELENGNQLSKTIIGNILKNRSIKTEEEIPLSTKYQVLSNNTALFGEIIQHSSQKSQLVKFKLASSTSSTSKCSNNYSSYGVAYKVGCCGSMSMLNYKSRPVMSKPNFSKKMKGAPMMSAAPRMMNAAPRVMNAAPKMSEETAVDLDDDDDDAISKNSKPRKVVGWTSLIEAQDSVGGFWEESASVDDLIKDDEVSPTYKKIEAFFESKEMDAKEKKRVIRTFVVLYYMHNFKKEKLEDLVFIIKKANQFLMRTTKMKYDELLKAL